MSLWRKCSTCKSEIPLNGLYYQCSVSSCNSKRKGYVFCSVRCFDSHVPIERHKNAGAIEERAPSRAEPVVDVSNPLSEGGVKGMKGVSDPPRRRIVSRSPVGVSSSSLGTEGQGDLQRRHSSGAASSEILVIASRLKAHILKESGMNTSASVMNILSDHIRDICEKAIHQARSDGRKTVMDRDFKL